MLHIADLPALNATLNGCAAILLVIAWILIKNGQVTWHKRTMLAAFATSAAFLTSYLIYHANAGSKPFTTSEKLIKKAGRPYTAHHALR